MQGCDFQKILSKSPARAWNILYSLLTDGLDEKKKAKVDSDIFRKPVGIHRPGGDVRDQSLMAGAAAYLKSLPPPPPAIDS